MPSSATAPCFPEPPDDPGRSDFPSPVRGRSTAPERLPNPGLVCVRTCETDDAGDRSSAVSGSPPPRPAPRPRGPSLRAACYRRASPLLRPHVPVLRPPAAFTLGLVGGSSPLGRSHGWSSAPSRPYLCPSFPRCPDPYPGRPHGARTRSFPRGIGLPPVRKGRRHGESPYGDFCTERISGLQSFRNVRASRFACHPGRSNRCGRPHGGRDVDVRAPHGS